MGRLAAYPIRSLLTTAQRFMEDRWEAWFRALLLSVNGAPYRVAHVTVTAGAAAIVAAVAYQTTPRVEAVYQVAMSLRISRASSGTSSATWTLGWTAGGVAQAEALAALTGNTTTTQVNRMITIRADPQTDITYSVAYASVGATTMTYDLSVVVFQLPDAV